MTVSGAPDSGRIFAFRYNGTTWDRLGNGNYLISPFALRTRNFLGTKLDISDDGSRIVAY